TCPGQHSQRSGLSQSEHLQRGMILIFAPETAVPCLSVTEPTILACVSCPCVPGLIAITKRAVNIHSTEFHFITVVLLFVQGDSDPQMSSMRLLSARPVQDKYYSPALLYRRPTPYLYAIDMLEMNGRDLRSRPLMYRKR